VADYDLTGVLLVGGASERFGSPKALARFGGEMLAVRAHRVLEDACRRVLVVGKHADALPLPFAVLDDGSEERAAIVGVAAGLRYAKAEVCIVLPTDMPLVSAALLGSLVGALDDADVAVVQTGPLPGAYRPSALAVLERRIATGELGLRDALGELEVRVVRAHPQLLRNINTPEELQCGAHA
jgi:molybdopterin-guanine dinucleotide biosynthesis protein A